jgi:hypothetical protein
MSCMEIIVVYSKNHTKHKTLCEKNSDYINVRVNVTHSNHSGLKGHHDSSRIVMNLSHIYL